MSSSLRSVSLRAPGLVKEASSRREKTVLMARGAGFDGGELNFFFFTGSLSVVCKRCVGT